MGGGYQWPHRQDTDLLIAEQFGELVVSFRRPQTDAGGCGSRQCCLQKVVAFTCLSASVSIANVWDLTQFYIPVHHLENTLAP